VGVAAETRDSEAVTQLEAAEQRSASAKATEQAGRSPQRRALPPRRRVAGVPLEPSLALRLGALLLYLAALGLTTEQRGFPVSRDRQLPWLLAGLIVVCVAFGRSWRRALLDWLPFAAALTAYDLLRGVAGQILPPHARPQLLLDKYLFGGGTTIPTIWLQHHLWNPSDITWYDYATWVVYLSYFLVVPFAAFALWWRSRERFRRFAVTILALSFAAFATYFLYPALPPWFASQIGLLPRVDQLIGAIGQHVPYLDYTALYENGRDWSNQIAAIPSLHAGTAMIVSLFFWPRAARPLRLLLALYPLAMGFALVYAGEHYVTDTLLGWLYAYGIWRLLRRSSWYTRLA
jgi:hypothetical protein